MTGAELQIVLLLAEKLGPTIIKVGSEIFDAIRNCGDLSDEAKASLVARATAAHAKAMAYEPKRV